MECTRGMFVYVRLLSSFMLLYSSNAQGQSFNFFNIGDLNALSTFGSRNRLSVNAVPTKATPLRKSTTVRGIIQPLVLGGDAFAGKYPFVVYIELDNGDDMCGGTLLSEDWVLTAAHCFKKTPTKILIGAFRNDGTDPNAVTRTMDRKCCHKDFNPRTLEHDICLMKLSSSVKYGIYIKKAKLPPANTKLTDGTKCIIMGWGYSFGQQLLAKLQEADVPVVNKDQCKAWYSQDNTFMPEHHFCAGYENGGADTCAGDSGGPLAVEENGEWIVRGVTSFGPVTCGISERPGVYTQVSHYVTWIRQKMVRPCSDHTWSSWITVCSVTCGTGVEKRTRECQDVNGQMVSASNCQGNPQQLSACTESPCKKYSWGPWKQTCSVTCGSGVETRTRDCLDELNKTAPFIFCGNDPAVKTTQCKLSACTYYFWEPWSTSCDVTCGTGIQTKTRTCADQNGNTVTNSLCKPGNAVEQGECQQPKCSTYAWQSWSTSCSVTCGIGIQRKSRKCVDQNGNNAPNSRCKPGNSDEQGQCKLSQCETYTWQSWSTSCSVTCGTGIQTKTRKCADQNGNDAPDSQCKPGNAGEQGQCKLSQCRIYGWGSWSTSCSVTCGIGTQTKTRQCRDQNRNTVSNALCVHGKAVEQGRCQLRQCKAFAWGPWSAWCSVTCGKGTQIKTRQCFDESSNIVSNSQCNPGKSEEQGQCNFPKCSTYMWSSWTTSCSVTCGTGRQRKTRKCLDHNRNIAANSLCPGNAFDQGQCRLLQCSKPINNGLQGLYWGPWKSWSPCRLKVQAANRCNGFKFTTRDCMSGGSDTAPQRCMMTIGEDYYKEAPCKPSSC